MNLAGCSCDSFEDLQAFAGKLGLRFPLVSDPDGEIAKSYGAFKDSWAVAGRATVVIDEDGTVLKTYPKAPLAGSGHAEEVLNDVRAILG